MSVTIVDATAGLGRDSFILASLGFPVILLERSPLIHALLENAMQRAKEEKETAPIIKRLCLFHADAISWLPRELDRPDMIYLDPMFPERQKSALVKKEMLIFQEIINDRPDEAVLLQIALSCAKKRVVVKRPRLAASVANRTPTFSVTGNSSRFDIYIINNLGKEWIR